MPRRVRLDAESCRLEESARREKNSKRWGPSLSERKCHELLLDFTWWVKRKDPEGKNPFAGGFLGLDDIGVFDRSRPLPSGGHPEQPQVVDRLPGFEKRMGWFLESRKDLAQHIATLARQARPGPPWLAPARNLLHCAP